MRRILFMLLMLAAVTQAGSQTLQQGRNYFANGNYVKAKPIMLKYLNQKPQDASRNYWYGICCMETGDEEKAIPYLETAASKKIFKANRALGEYYMKTGSYELAIDNFRQFVSGISSDKALHDSILEARFTFMADSLETLSKMMRSTRKVCFIDSVIIHKDQLMSKLKLSDQAGRLTAAGSFFGAPREGEVYMPETGQSIVYSRMDTDGHYSLYRSFKSFDEWDDEVPIEGLFSNANIRYPFLLADGNTLYFASDCEESMGGLDIFVSRINPATGRYFKPENIGMPFSSSANDYMMAIDESSNLGWFATDRGMHPDSVCLYVFLPETMDQYYSVETSSNHEIASAAALTSIKATQTDMSQVARARQRLIMLGNVGSQTDSPSFTYIVDDLTIYHNVTDFHSPEARGLFQRYEMLKEEFSAQQSRLDSMRGEYAAAVASARNSMRDGLLELENQVLAKERLILQMENEIRTVELNCISK